MVLRAWWLSGGRAGKPGSRRRQVRAEGLGCEARDSTGVLCHAWRRRCAAAQRCRRRGGQRAAGGMPLLTVRGQMNHLNWDMRRAPYQAATTAGQGRQGSVGGTSGGEMGGAVRMGTAGQAGRSRQEAWQRAAGQPPRNGSDTAHPSAPCPLGLLQQRLAGGSRQLRPAAACLCRRSPRGSPPTSSWGTA